MPTMKEVMSHVTGWPRAVRWSEFPHINKSRVPGALAECSASFRLVTMPMVRSGSGATINPNFRIEVFIQPNPMPGDTGTWVVKGSETAGTIAARAGALRLGRLGGPRILARVVGVTGRRADGPRRDSRPRDPDERPDHRRVGDHQRAVRPPIARHQPRPQHSGPRPLEHVHPASYRQLPGARIKLD
jgi:hypothetical protein